MINHYFNGDTPITPDNSIELLSEAYKRMNNVNTKSQKEPYIPLKELNLTLSRLWLLNNYEVNLIENSYLLLWGQDTSLPYIFVNQLLSQYPEQYHNLIKAFFIENSVTYYDYFNFICFFLFFDINHIFLLLISMCHIHSNYCINKSKVEEFLAMLNSNLHTYPDIFIYLEQYKIDLPDMQNNTYSLKSFIHYFTNSYIFQDYIYKLKHSILVLTVNESNYNNIMQRQMYFKSQHSSNGGSSNNREKSIIIKKESEEMNKNKKKNNEKQLIYPLKRKEKVEKEEKEENNMNPFHESCSSKLFRLLFTNAPPPDEYDYSFDSYSQDNFEKVTLSLRQRYGYSYRISYCCNEFRPRSSKRLSHYSLMSSKQTRIRSHSTDAVSFISQTSLSPKCYFSRYKIVPISPNSCKLCENHASS